MSAFHWVHGDPNAPVLLCLHGIGSCADAFIPQHPLADAVGRRVVAWDAPGYRNSADPEDEPGLDGWADAAAELVASLGVDRVDLLGVSWGGVTATRVALRHPHLIASLTIADSSVGSGTTPERSEAMRARATAVADLGIEEFASSRAPALFGPDPDPSVVQVAEELMRDSVRLPPYQWACDSMADADHRDDLPSIDAPTLVIYGENDGVTPPSLSKQLAAGIPGAELVEIADAGHLANQERPDEFNSAVADFLGRRSPLGQGGTP